MILLPLWLSYCAPSTENNNKLNITTNTNTCSDGWSVILLILLIALSIFSAYFGWRKWYNSPTDIIKVNGLNSESSKKLFLGFFGTLIGACFGPIYLVYYFIFYTWLSIGWCTKDPCSWGL